MHDGDVNPPLLIGRVCGCCTLFLLSHFRKTSLTLRSQKLLNTLFNLREFTSRYLRKLIFQTIKNANTPLLCNSRLPEYALHPASSLELLCAF